MSVQASSKEIKKGYGLTLVLLMFGVLAFYGGASWLLVLIPAAVLVWCAANGVSVSRSGN
jgi:hypothetical protein